MLSCLERAFHSPQNHQTLARTGEGTTGPRPHMPITAAICDKAAPGGSPGAKAQVGTPSAPGVSFLHAPGGHWLCPEAVLWAEAGAGTVVERPGCPGRDVTLPWWARGTVLPGETPAPSTELALQSWCGWRGCRARAGRMAQELTGSSAAVLLGPWCGTSDPTV